jgi:hypothetical protein
MTCERRRFNQRIVAGGRRLVATTCERRRFESKENAATARTPAIQPEEFLEIRAALLAIAGD